MISNLHPFANAVVELFPQGERKIVVVFTLCVEEVWDESEDDVDINGGKLLKIRTARFVAVKQRIMI